MKGRTGYLRLLCALVLLGPLALTSVGCAIFECKVLWPLYGARLDERTDVQLSEYRQDNLVLAGPKYNYGELWLALISDGTPVLRDVVARQGAKDRKGLPGFGLGELEGRTDADRKRIWIVDRGCGRVIATADRDTGVITGLDDETPVWAKPDEGVVLEMSSSDSDAEAH